MMTRHNMIDEDDFQAFVDGQLPPERVRAVMAYLASNPEESARMSEYRKLSEGLHSLFDEVMCEPLPHRLTVEYYRGRRSWRDMFASWFDFGIAHMAPRLATAACLLLAAGYSGWWLKDQAVPSFVSDSGETSFARQAANAHHLFAPDLRYPVEFGADQEASLLQWLSERLGQAVYAPNLQDIGLSLVGGRLLPASDKAAAQLMYEGELAGRVTLYIRGRWNSPITGAKEGTVSYLSEGELSMVYWINGPLAYALMGKMDREQLFATAQAVQQQLETPSMAPVTPEQTTVESEANAT